MMKVIYDFSIFIATIGTLVMTIGAISYFGTRGHDHQLINSKFGILGHRYFLFGIGIYLSGFLIRVAVNWIDPSLPIFGSGVFWRRILGGSNFDENNLLP